MIAAKKNDRRQSNENAFVHRGLLPEMRRVYLNAPNIVN
jgi:hypothetical protein